MHSLPRQPERGADVTVVGSPYRVVVECSHVACATQFGGSSDRYFGGELAGQHGKHRLEIGGGLVEFALQQSALPAVPTQPPVSGYLRLQLGEQFPGVLSCAGLERRTNESQRHLDRAPVRLLRPGSPRIDRVFKLRTCDASRLLAY